MTEHPLMKLAKAAQAFPSSKGVDDHEVQVQSMGELFMLQHIAVGTKVRVSRISTFVLTEQPATNPVNWKNVSTSWTRSFTVTWLMGRMDVLREGWQPGCELAADQRTILRIVANQTEAALNHAFSVGNRQLVDSDGKEWSPDVRSVSIGDVALIEYRDGTSTFREVHAVRHVGFELVNPEDVAVSFGVDALRKVEAAA